VIAAGGKKNVLIAAERRDSKTVINVIDSGVGLKEKYFEEVFTPFSSDQRTDCTLVSKRSSIPRTNTSLAQAVDWV
jgi:light-regulated signal transduction histidine kinase (bacteriophytochrome)